MQLKILIAEDQHPFLYADVLNLKNGFEFVFANNGVEAVRQAQTIEFDCILMDVRLPRLNGIEATRQIRAFNKLTPIIIFTAYGDYSTREDAKAAGCNDFFTKPPNFEQLARRIIDLACRKRQVKHAAKSEEMSEAEWWQKSRRLEALKLQAALMGIDTPPHITIEIEDLERQVTAAREKRASEKESL